MEILGYYAKNKFNDLFQFEWDEDDTFKICINGVWEKSDPKEFEILEIGFAEYYYFET